MFCYSCLVINFTYALHTFLFFFSFTISFLVFSGCGNCILYFSVAGNLANSVIMGLFIYFL